MTIRRTIVQRNYDSVLDGARPGQPAKLTIRLGVKLVPLDPSVPRIAGSPSPPPAHLATGASPVRHGLVNDYLNSRSVKCRSWTVAEWNTYKIRFKRAVEQAWNNQIILLPTDSGGNDELNDEDYRQFISSPTIRAHCIGAIDVELVPLNLVGHALIEVVHLEKPRDAFRVWMHRITDESVQFATHTDPDWPAWFTGQVTAAHEVGHWLRSLTQTHFEHIDAEAAKILPGPVQARKQYGLTIGREVALMGAGSLVTEHEASPWLTRIRRHTSKLGWTMIHSTEFRRVMYNIPERQKDMRPNI